MPRADRRTCLQCGGRDSEVGPISHGGLCSDCGQRNLRENIWGIATQTGIAHRRRIGGMQRYIDRMRLDMQRATSLDS